MQQDRLSQVSIRTLRRWKNEVKTSGRNTPLKPPGRPEKFNDRTVRQIKRTAINNPFYTIQEIKEAINIDACKQTITKILKKSNRTPSK